MGDLNDDIERYRQGKMTPAEMHALEKKALYDPFLADALEGASSITAEDLSNDIAYLNEKIAPKKTQVFTPLRIAAGVIVIIGVAIFALWPQEEPVKLSKLEQQEAPPTVADSLKGAEPAAAATPDVTKPEQPPIFALKKSADGKTESQYAPPVVQIPEEQQPVAGITKEDTATIASTADRQAARLSVAKDEVDKIAEAEIEEKDDAQMLSEVVVKSKPIQRENTDEPLIRSAEPVGGIKAYNKYMEDNLRYPQQALDNKIKGRVIVEFSVGLQGELDDFVVVKSLGYGCDEEVIRLVKDGPDWIVGTEDNVPVETNVRVRMKFDPAKGGGKK